MSIKYLILYIHVTYLRKKKLSPSEWPVLKNTLGPKNQYSGKQPFSEFNSLSYNFQVKKC
jgi:hypothetical protein